jgi:hypothetical protein
MSKNDYVIPMKWYSDFINKTNNETNFTYQKANYIFSFPEENESTINLIIHSETYDEICRNIGLNDTYCLIVNNIKDFETLLLCLNKHGLFPKETHKTSSELLSDFDITELFNESNSESSDYKSASSESISESESSEYKSASSESISESESSESESDSLNNKSDSLDNKSDNLI